MVAAVKHHAAPDLRHLANPGRVLEDASAATTCRPRLRSHGREGGGRCGRRGALLHSHSWVHSSDSGPRRPHDVRPLRYVSPSASTRKRSVVYLASVLAARFGSPVGGRRGRNRSRSKPDAPTADGDSRPRAGSRPIHAHPITETPVDATLTSLEFVQRTPQQPGVCSRRCIHSLCRTSLSGRSGSGSCGVRARRWPGWSRSGLFGSAFLDGHRPYVYLTRRVDGAEVVGGLAEQRRLANHSTTRRDAASEMVSLSSPSPFSPNRR
jgi:hypothetical protein